MPAFQYTAEILAAMEGALTKERLATYLSHAIKTNPSATGEDALDLYVWNLQVSAALQGPLHLLEVGLRNALHRNLIKGFCTDWIDDARFIHACILAQYPPPQQGQKTSKVGPDLLKDIHKVRNRVAETLRVRNARAAKLGQPIIKAALTVNDVVAGLDFGFWTTMLDYRFEQSLWRPVLYHAFPNYTAMTNSPLERKPIEQRFNTLRELRNRVMHHEPLFNRNLQQDFQDIAGALSWMYSDVSEWVNHHSRWPVIQKSQANRPETF